MQHQQPQNPQNNASVTADLESIRSLFNEKEKELSMAVSKVEELTGMCDSLFPKNKLRSSRSKQQ